MAGIANPRQSSDLVRYAGGLWSKQCCLNTKVARNYYAGSLFVVAIYYFTQVELIIS